MRRFVSKSQPKTHIQSYQHTLNSHTKHSCQCNDNCWSMVKIHFVDGLLIKWELAMDYFENSDENFLPAEVPINSFLPIMPFCWYCFGAKNEKWEKHAYFKQKVFSWQIVDISYQKGEKKAWCIDIAKNRVDRILL